MVDQPEVGRINFKHRRIGHRTLKQRRFKVELTTLF